MGTNRKQWKKNAREAMRETKPRPFWICLAVMAILLVLQLLGASLNGDFAAVKTMLEGVMAGQLAYVEPTGATGFGVLLLLALDVMSMVVSVGFVLYCMRVARREGASFGDVFDAFGILFRAIWVSLLPSLLLSAWSMLYALPTTYFIMFTGAAWVIYAALPLLIPMFVAAYSYRLTVFLVLDNPQMSCMQCLFMSRAVMRGHKWELFKLDLSFIGWGLLSLVPFVALWVVPYVNLTCVEYYKTVTAGFMERNMQNIPPQPPQAPEE